MRFNCFVSSLRSGLLLRYAYKKEEPKPGLFGSSMTWILEVLPYLKRKGVRPRWDIDTVCYGQLFPAILKAKGSAVAGPIGPVAIQSLVALKKAHGYSFKGDEWAYAHELFFDYFDIDDGILEEVSSLQLQFNGKTLGIHYRGTDKIGTEATLITKADVIKNIVGFLAGHDEYKTIFVASDETEFIRMMESSFGKYKLIFTNSTRSVTGRAVHGPYKDISGAKEAMVDSLTLSKCDFVIKTSSCLSDWVKIWNPAISVYNLNKFKMGWFPQAFIPVRSFL